MNGTGMVVSSEFKGGRHAIKAPAQESAYLNLVRSCEFPDRRRTVVFNLFWIGGMRQRIS